MNYAPKKYEIAFDATLHEELRDLIEALGHGLFDVDEPIPALHRRKWMNIGYVAIGKAMQLEHPDYKWADAHGLNWPTTPSAEEGEEYIEWIVAQVRDLKAIYRTIFAFFLRGDGKI